jgi:hypothetical protein
MGDIIIRDLDDALIVQLKRQAWYQGLPFEEAMRRLVIASIQNDREDIERVPMPRGPYFVAEREPVAHGAMFHS